MNTKLCPQCHHYSISFDYNRGVEVCRWRDCSWVNADRTELPTAHKTVVTSHTNHQKTTSSVTQTQPAY